MKKVIFAVKKACLKKVQVKRIYTYILSLSYLDDKRNYSIFKLRILLLCTHKSVSRIYIIYIQKKYFVKRY